MPPIGRPKANNPKAVNLTVRLDAETEKKLLHFCTINNISRGEAIRQGIHLLLETKK